MGSSQSRDRRDSNSMASTSAFNYRDYLNMTYPNYIQCDAPPPPPPPLPSGGDVPPPPPPPSSSSSNDSSDSSSIPQIPTFSVPNPGPYEAATMPCRALTSVDTYDGFRMEIQKQLSPFMLVMHNFTLGTTILPDGSNKAYNFLTQVVDETSMYATTFDPYKKAVSGRIIRSLLGGALTAKLQLAVSPDGSNDQLLGEVDIGGGTWMGKLTYGSMGGGIVAGMNYYQGVTERLAIGGEGMYVAANGNLMNSYTVKYEMPASSGSGAGDDVDGKDEKGGDAIGGAAASAGGDLSAAPSSWFLAQLNPAQGMLNLYYKRVVTPNRVALGAELMVVPTLESQLTLGAEFKLQRSKVAMTVDGTGKIQSVVETKMGMGPESPTLSLNAEVDHAKDSMKFGYGLSVGS